MDCNETRRLLEAAIDGELDLVRQLELEDHWRGCAACTRLADALRARRAALRESLPRFAAPPQLADRVRAAIRDEVAPVAVPISSGRRIPANWLNWSAVGLAASAAIALTVGYAWGDARAHGNLLIDEAVADHLRSLQFNHLSDVVSTDQHTVKPWFAGKLDFAPPVVDLAAAGFPLAGGRLERLAGHPAAALVFRRREHAINLFVWPAAGDAVSPREAELNGYHALSWSQGGFNFLAVSEIPAAEVRQFAAAFQAADRG
jgi:anti-sigma factor RsiW